MKDFYAILEVSRGASTEVIRASYRILAKKYHPDNQETGNPTMFRAVKDAEAVLCNDAKRREYDLQSSQAQYEGNGHQQQPQGRPVWRNGIGWVITQDAGPFPGDMPSSQYGQPMQYCQAPMEEMMREAAYNLGHMLAYCLKETEGQEMMREAAYNLGHSFVDRLMEELRNARRHR